MTLAAGSSLSHYTILGPLGAGAMGEVYRARDTRLGREVALKVLPEHFADDEERLRRFEREARSLAALNHPNVAQIHGVDQVGDACFLVLELVPGETLEERLRRGALPLDEALDVARQIADGLEAAHEAGVVHRDLKPANVRITPDGKVKVLDFGLAKPVHEQGQGSSTDSALSTEAGRLLGTPTYMAPEQARGKPIDKRVDVWSFGCVLYECLTGERAFSGDTLSDVLAAVLHAEPALEKLPAVTPARLRELLERCLAKDPRRRLRDVGDARLELERAAAGDPRPVEARVRRDGRRAALLVGIVVAAVVLAGAAGWLAARAMAPRTSPALRWLELAEGGFGKGSATAISPDGGRIVYSSPDPARRGARLRLRALDREGYRELLGAQARLVNPFFAPDGERIGGFTGEGLVVMQLDSGNTTTLVRCEDYAQGAWSSAGGIVFSGPLVDGTPSTGLAWISEAGGMARPITRVATGELRHAWPEVLPDGRTVLFSVVGAQSTSIAVGSIEGGEHRILLRQAARPRYASTGHLLYGDDKGNLVATSFDAESATIRGSPTVLVEGLLEVPDGGGAFDISGEGTLVYTLEHDYEAPARSVFLVDRAGTTERVPLETGQWEEAKLSPDAHSLALRRLGYPDCSAWVFDRRRELLTRVPIEGDAHELSWSPDGKSLVFTLDQRGRHRVCRIPSDGSGPREELSRDELDYREGVPLGDGRSYVCTVRAVGGANLDIVLLDGESGTSRPLIETPALELNPAVSPDGRWLAYASNESDRDRTEVYVRSFPNTGRRVQVSSAGGFLPRWSRDGRELYYVEEERLMWVGIDTALAPDVSDPALEVSAPSPVFPEASGRWTRIGYDVTPDPASFVLIEGDGATTDSTLHVVLGWPQALGRATAR